jgi:hypothetical protein
MEAYLTGLRGMLEKYTLPSTGKILDFMLGAAPSGPDDMGLFKLSGFGVSWAMRATCGSTRSPGMCSTYR